MSEAPGEVFVGCSPALGSAGAVAGDLAGVMPSPSRQVTSRNLHVEETTPSELDPILVPVDELLLLVKNNPLSKTSLSSVNTPVPWGTSWPLAGHPSGRAVVAPYSPLEREKRLEASAAPPHPSSSKDAPLAVDHSMRDDRTPQTCWQAASVGKCDGFREVSEHKRN